MDSSPVSLDHEAMTFSPPAPARRGRLVPIAETECWQLLNTTTVGRLAFTTDNGIVILPDDRQRHRDPAGQLPGPRGEDLPAN